MLELVSPNNVQDCKVSKAVQTVFVTLFCLFIMYIYCFLDIQHTYIFEENSTMKLQTCSWQSMKHIKRA